MYENSMRAGSIGNQASTAMVDAPRTQSALEAHLSFMGHLSSRIYDALERASKMADRLVGSDPQPIRGQNAQPEKPPAQPCMTRQLEESAMTLAHLVDGLHEQLGRLDRL